MMLNVLNGKELGFFCFSVMLRDSTWTAIQCLFRIKRCWADEAYDELFTKLWDSKVSIVWELIKVVVC